MHRDGMVMEAAPAAAFVMAKAKLLLELPACRGEASKVGPAMPDLRRDAAADRDLQIVALDPPTQFRQVNELIEHDVGRQVGEPEFAGFRLVIGPLDQEPELRPGFFALIVTDSETGGRWTDAFGSKA